MHPAVTQRQPTHASRSIPFFFEPNFNAYVAPLAAADRIQDSHDARHFPGAEDPPPKKTYAPTVYGDFLMRKVNGNFAAGGGKYGA